MFCKNCGRQIPDNAPFCPACGTKRSDSGTSADERSGVDIRNLPSYAKEIDRSGQIIDSDRKKFSLSDPDRRKFSLSDSGRDKFSLSDSGRDKFSLSDKSRKGDDGGIVRLTSSREPAEQKKEPAAPRKEPVGFVNPMKDSGGTVFRSGSAPDTTAAGRAKDKTATPADDTTVATASSVQSEQTAPREPDAVIEGNDNAGGFVNPLKEAGRDIHWGSDGDRNQKTPDIGEIDSHMGFAIIVTALSCCNCLSLATGIAAIVFASQVSKYVRDGNFEQAKKSADTAYTLCWVSLGFLVLGFATSVFTDGPAKLLEELAP